MLHSTQYHAATSFMGVAVLLFGSFSTSATENIEKPVSVKVIDYCPAPTQFANLEIATTPHVVETPLTGGNDDTTEGIATLGAFGGYIVLKFDRPVDNDPRHPYGVDFVVGGNALSSGSGESCEPAVVQVMKDSNGNGIPDDGPWIELAGSDYWLSSTQKNFTATYANPFYTVAHQVRWNGNDSTTGALLPTDYRNNPMMPDPYLLPAFTTDGFIGSCHTDICNYALTGTRIAGYYDLHNPQGVKMFHTPAFGYADSRSTPASLSPSSPRNPYVKDENGDPVDGFDISWGVDENGHHVELDRIDFVRIHTAGLQNGGWTGEWSSEIRGIMVMEPDENWQARDIWMHYIGGSQQRIAVGRQAQFEGLLFKNGRPQTEGTPVYTIADPSIASVDDNGVVTALKEGKTMLSYTQKQGIEPATIPIWVSRLTGVVFIDEKNKATSTASTTLPLGGRLWLNAMSTDNAATTIAGEEGDRYQFDTYTWLNSNTDVGTIDAYGTFTPLKTGTTVITAQSVTNPKLYAEMQIKVTAPGTPTQLKKELTISSEAPYGNLQAKQIFRASDKSLPLITSVESSKGLPYFTLRDNRIIYDCSGATESFSDILTLATTHFGLPRSYTITVNYTTEAGIDEIATGSDRAIFPAEVYTITGLRILNAENLRQIHHTLPSGIYILRPLSGKAKPMKIHVP